MRYFRFSLRFLFIAITLLGCYLAACQWRSRQIREWNRLVDRINEAPFPRKWEIGTDLHYPNGPKLNDGFTFDSLLTNERMREIRILDIYAGSIDETLIALSDLGVREIGHFRLAHRKLEPDDPITFSDRTLELLCRLHIHSLMWRTERRPSDSFVRGLFELEGLREISISGDWLNDEMLVGIKPSPTIELIRLRGPVTKTILPTFESFPQLAHIDLQMTNIQRTEADAFALKLLNRSLK